MKIGIIKERKSPPDKRVVFSPQTALNVITRFPKTTIKVESSQLRVFPDESYTKAGIEISADVSDCDLLLGVKEVPIANLIPHKSYFFFSHTLKKQPYNRKLLQTVLQKNITLYDYERITNSNGHRLIGFGRYAGIVGAYNGLRLYGLKYKKYLLSPTTDLSHVAEMEEQLATVSIPNIKIIVTGKGYVSHGVQTLLRKAGIQKVSIESFLNKELNTPVFAVADVLDYNRRKDGAVIDKQDFYKDPECYQSDFKKFAETADLYIAGHFWKPSAPPILNIKDIKSQKNTINVIADISCDINGPIASTLRASSTTDPFYGFHRITGQETDFMNKNAIAVMAVDNLPCELAAEASTDFGEMFKKNVLPAFFNGDKDGILYRARMTAEGKLTSAYRYLQDYVDGKE